MSCEVTSCHVMSRNVMSRHVLSRLAYALVILHECFRATPRLVCISIFILFRNVEPRKLSFHPGSAAGGSDLHSITRERITVTS